MGNNDPIAAAVVAAAELAKNGGAYLYPTTHVVVKHDTTPSVVSFPFSSSSDTASNEESSTLTDDEEEEEEEGEEDAERRMARSRERNREHARRTRLRKKAQLEALQSKVKGLQAESKVLRQSLEECSIASILVGLSSGSHDSMIQSLVKVATDAEDKMDVLKTVIVGGKRKRFVCPTKDNDNHTERVAQPLKIKIAGKTTVIGGGRTHINWKTGVYSDEVGAQRQLTQEQLESLRRERNRMHAKMTRDRKKSFISTIEKTIQDLESNNQRMKNALTNVIQTHFKSSTPVPGVTPVSSPVMRPRENVISPLHHEEYVIHRPAKKVCHGFSLGVCT